MSTVSTVAAAVSVSIVALVIMAVLVIIGVLVFMHRKKQKKSVIEFGSAKDEPPLHVISLLVHCTIIISSLFLIQFTC